MIWPQMKGEILISVIFVFSLVKTRIVRPDLLWSRK
jgi:hypothetical protein